MARRCGAKHIFKSKCTKHHRLGPIFDVLIRKNGTPLWREAHLQVKMHKTPQRGTDFGSSNVKKWHAAVARSTFASQNLQKTTCSGHFDVEKSHAAVARSTFAKHLRFGKLLELPMW